jgi:hypothetical protein
VVFLISPGKYQHSASIRPRALPFKSFSILAHWVRQLDLNVWPYLSVLGSIKPLPKSITLKTAPVRFVEMLENPQYSTLPGPESRSRASKFIIHQSSYHIFDTMQSR